MIDAISPEVTLVADENRGNGEKKALVDETKSTETQVQKQLSNVFDPQKITVLNLSQVKSCKKEIFHTGCLPEWLLNFVNLEELYAAKVGIVILEPWILNLSRLNTLDLEQNQITTWPSFLSESTSIQTVILDGNPCLEKAFQKSPTFRSFYFSWNATKDSNRRIPFFIRGPEWHMASTARSSNSININHLGFFCGGIYTLATRTNLSNEGYLTPIEPCPIISRNNSSFEEVSSRMSLSQNNLHHQTTSLYKEEGKRQTQIIMEIFDDINSLKKRYDIKRPKKKQQFALLVGTMKDSFNMLLKGSLEKLNLDEMQIFARQLLAEEEMHIKNLQIVVHEFYYTKKIRSPNVAWCLRDCFSGFPAMDIIHSKAILPALQRFCKALGYSQLRRRNPKYVPEYPVSSTIVEMCTAFRKLQLTMQKYCENLWQTEHHFDLPNSPTRMYHDLDFKSYVEKQIARLGGIGGHLSVGGVSPGIELKMLYGEDETGNIDIDKHIMADWLYKQEVKNKKKFKHDCVNFVYLPLVRLVRYERFFTSFAGTDNSYQPLLRVLRRLRKNCATTIEQSCKNVRIHVLSSKFRCSATYFQHYRWDAVLTVKSRGYLEPGILSLNTNDVLDYDGTPSSFIKEVFHDSRLRIMRLVCCGNDIFIWDEIFEHLVGKLPKSDIAVLPLESRSNKSVRILFITVRETCVCEVKDFNAKYPTKNHPNQEIIEAFSFKAKKKIL